MIQKYEKTRIITPKRYSQKFHNLQLPRKQSITSFILYSCEIFHIRRNE